MVQEDQIHSTMNRILKYVVDNSKLLLGILAAFVVVSLAIFFWSDYRTGQGQELQSAYGKALEKFHATAGETPAADPNNPAPEPSRYKTDLEKFTDAEKAFTELSAKAKGTALYPYSRYYEGLCRLELGKKSDFTSIMEQLAQSESGSEVASLALLSMAESYLAEGNTEKATENYEKILKDAKTSLPKDEILYSLAEHHLNKKDKAKAIELWKRLVKEFPDSKVKPRAESQLTELGEKAG